MYMSYDYDFSIIENQFFQWNYFMKKLLKLQFTFASLWALHSIILPVCRI